MSISIQVLLAKVYAVPTLPTPYQGHTVLLLGVFPEQLPINLKSHLGVHYKARDTVAKASTMGATHSSISLQYVYDASVRNASG